MRRISKNIGIVSLSVHHLWFVFVTTFFRLILAEGEKVWIRVGLGRVEVVEKPSGWVLDIHLPSSIIEGVKTVKGSSG